MWGSIALCSNIQKISSVQFTLTFVLGKLMLFSTYSVMELSTYASGKYDYSTCFSWLSGSRGFATSSNSEKILQNKIAKITT